jgi:hypothetical protein
MCECDGISNDKIQVYKIVDSETAPQELVYTNINDAIAHFQFLIENLDVGENFELKITKGEMTESQFENLPEYEGN